MRVKVHEKIFLPNHRLFSGFQACHHTHKHRVIPLLTVSPVRWNSTTSATVSAVMDAAVDKVLNSSIVMTCLFVFKFRVRMS